MIRAGLLALLMATLLAGDPTAPTPVQWPAGRISLTDCVARLSAAGNTVWLADEVDDRVEAELPAVDGVWWDGVKAVCEAFQLRPDDGDPSEDRMDGQGVAVPVGHGTLILSPGPPPAMQVAGGLLAAIESDGGVGLWLRAEPRVPRGQLAWGRVEAAAMDPATPEGLESIELLPDAERGLARWHCNSSIAPESRFVATVQVASIGRWNADSAVSIGQDLELDVHGRTVTAVLLTAPEVATWQGTQLPERRPLLAIALPGDLAQNLQMRLRSGEADLSLRNGGSRNAGDGRTVMFRYLRTTPEGQQRLILEGRLTQAPQRIEIRQQLPAKTARQSASPPEAPSRVTWEAGRAPLSRWLQLLSATGNPVLPEVGVDTAEQFTLPAQRGGFWDGILAVCRVAGLAPAFDPGTSIIGGAVRLVRKPLPPCASCGPFLILASAIDGQPGQLDITIRCIVEPRLPADGFGAPNVAWSSWAEDEDGGAHPLSIPFAQSDSAGMRPERAVMLRRDGEQQQPPAQTQVHLTRSGVRQIDISGMLFVPRVRMWKTTVDAIPGQPVEALLGGRAVELTAIAAPMQMNGSQWGPGIVLRGLVGAQSLQYAVAGADGVAIDQAGEANRMGGQLPGRPWLAWCRVPAEGQLSIQLAARASLAPLSIPLRLTVPVPEGL
jgi:hypothetical protein